MTDGLWSSRNTLNLFTITFNEKYWLQKKLTIEKIDDSVIETNYVMSRHIKTSSAQAWWPWQGPCNEKEKSRDASKGQASTPSPALN